MEIAGTRRFLLHQLKLEQQVKASMGAPPPAPLQTTSSRVCKNSKGNVCMTPASTPTLVVIGVGMGAMIFLVMVAILLLCRSHILYRRSLERHRQAAVAATEAMAAAETGGIELVSSTVEPEDGNNNFLLVLFPGEKYTVTCAHISPLHHAAVESSTTTVPEPSPTNASSDPGEP